MATTRNPAPGQPPEHAPADKGCPPRTEKRREELEPLDEKSLEAVMRDCPL